MIVDSEEESKPEQGEDARSISPLVIGAFLVMAVWLVLYWWLD